MSTHRILWCVVAVAGCVDSIDEIDAPEESSTTSAVLGSPTWSGCLASDLPHLQRAFTEGQLAANSPAFAECVDRSIREYNQAGDPTINIGPYRPCTHDAVGTTAGVVLAHARSLNPIQFTCDYNLVGTSEGGNAYIGDIGLGDSATQESLTIGSVLGNPSDHPRIANTIFHEIMHQHGFDHAEGTYACGISPMPSYGNSIPYIVGECMSSVLKKSAAQCSAITTCGEGMAIVDSVYPASSTCGCIAAPQHQQLGPRIQAVRQAGANHYYALDNTPSLVGTNWSPTTGFDAEWTSFVGGFLAPPAVVMGARGSGTIDFVGLGTDSHFYHRPSTGSTWVQLPGFYLSAPSVVSWGQNRIDVFGQGTDRRYYHHAWTGPSTGWQARELVGGVFNGPPAAIARGVTMIDIVGRGTDNRYYHKSYTGSAYTPSSPDAWNPVRAGVYVSDPVLAGKVTSLDILGQGTDMRYYHTGTVGQNPTLIGGGQFLGPPSAAWQSTSRLDVVGQGNNGWYYHYQMASGSWQPLEGLPMAGYGGATLMPSATGVDVIVEGTDHHGYYMNLTGNAWTGVYRIPGNQFLD